MPTNTSFPTPLSSQLALYVGIQLGNIVYGVEVYLYFKTMYIFMARGRARQKSDLFYALFSTVVFTTKTIFVALVWMINQAGWLTDQNHPPRRVAFALLDIAGLLDVILQLLTDALMIYRCRIVWDSLRAITIPFILWLATLASGIMYVWIRAVTFTNPFDGRTVKISFAYYTISVTLTAIMTCMICGRLIYYGRLMKKHLGQEYAAPYFSTVMLIVESMLPYSLAGIALLGAFLARSPAAFTILEVYGFMMCISPQMLILRVAAGRAWREETIKPLQSMVMFAPDPGDTSNSDGMGSVVHLESLPGVSPLTRPDSGEGDKV
ncbi:hypothetical protein EV363DRAFT_1216252 [Boletus edulis]|uniref:Uncharacterized protein n=1 Tax=Boletus edulis BED1 TaxID=1328754 RepID=A0AAD4BZ44_BOLED|nr:hypothetical protein EV363DRAFT_1216252 [Boletus edulis]KAF8444024.1 hypothetical protein L210DRAFT_3445100 [Boletus edulis BED1]